ncbi:HU-CCDC81_euk_2 domain-containing protein [Trichonephila clavipes]|nr:HU-CCDC81_euk_2 domain-containing protein [Trichonephila clavipes]
MAKSAVTSSGQIRRAETHKVNCDTILITEKELNPRAIDVKTQITRSKVVLTMNELIMFIERRLYAKEDVELPVCGVGTLRIIGEEHRMEFNEQFLKEVTMEAAMHVLEDVTNVFICFYKFLQLRSFHFANVRVPIDECEQWNCVNNN